jgi:Tfp pilus assembly pilus retraction ATPase PilT
MANAYLLERLLETCARRGGSEVVLMAGHSPLIRIDGRLREIQTGPVDALAAREMVNSLRSHSPSRRCGSWVEFVQQHYGREFHIAVLGRRTRPL